MTKNTFLLDEVRCIVNECMPIKLSSKMLIKIMKEAIMTEKEVSKNYIIKKYSIINKRIPRENEDKNIEYKLKLEFTTSSRLLSLTTQMHWRLNEGSGICHYLLGVSDDGKLNGIDIHCLNDSICVLKEIAIKNKAHINDITIIEICDECFDSLIDSKLHYDKHCINSLYLASVEICADQIMSNFSELRIAVLGSSLSGKSTLISVLANGELDDGYGSARKGRFRHFHEEISGVTSSSTVDVIGIDYANSLQNYSSCNNMKCIIGSSNRVIAFIDLAGNLKYIKRTFNDITSNHPHFCMLVIDSSSKQPLDDTTLIHLEFILNLNIPIILVINKIDKYTINGKGAFEMTKKSIYDMLTKKCLKFSIFNNNNIDNIGQDYNSNVVNIFEISCTTGYGLETLTKYLISLNFTKIQHNIVLMTYCKSIFNSKQVLFLYRERCVFQIKATFKSNYSNELVVEGIVVSGIFMENSNVFLGPITKSGEFKQVNIISIERYRSKSKIADYQQDAGISLNLNYDFKLPKYGCILIDRLNDVEMTSSFLCKICSKNKNLKIETGFRSMMHFMNIVRPVVITSVRRVFEDTENSTINGVVVLRFENGIHHVIVGECFILRYSTNEYIQGRIVYGLSN